MAYEQTSAGKPDQRRWIPWATLLRKVFDVDVRCCPKCASRMQRLAVIMRPSVIQAILDCIRRKEQPP